MEGTDKPGKSLMTEIPTYSAEDKTHNSVSRRHRQDGREVFEVSSNSPQPRPLHSKYTSSNPTSTSSSSVESQGRKRQRGAFLNPQLATEKKVRVAKAKQSVEKPQRLKGMKPHSSKLEAGSGKQCLSPPRAKTPGPSIQEEYQAGSFEACLNYDSSLSSSGVSCHKRKRKSTWKAEAQSPGAKNGSRSMSESFRDLPFLLDASPFPEVNSSLQASLPTHGLEDSSLHTDREAAPWAFRTNLRTPVYSGRTPARSLPQKSQQGQLANPDCTWKIHSQVAPEECQLWSQQKGESQPQTRTCKPTNTQTETQTHLRLQQSSELRLKALIARIQSSQAKEHQDRQTKLIAIHALTTNPGQHADSAPRREVSAENANSLRKTPGPDLVKRVPRLALGSIDKTKRPAPLMAKTLKDYKTRWSRK